MITPLPLGSVFALAAGIGYALLPLAPGAGTSG
jgi:hypothetical protein